MPLKPDYQIDVGGSSGSAIQIDAIPSSRSDGDRWGKDFPYTPKEFEKIKQEVFNNKRPRKSKQDFFDRLILLHAESDTPSKVSENATDKEKEADRIRRLQAPTTRRRFIFSRWPRDSKGKAITPDNSKLGKMAANEIQHWGATLFDFYYVRRMPDFGGLQTTSTGSKLATWMKANGEDYAKDELELAEEEEDPQEIFPCDIVKLVETTENRERTGISEMLRGSDRGGKGKEKEFFRHEPFDATFTSLPILQQRLPLHLLPTTLHVHDPFRLLQVQRGSNGEHSQAAQSWSSQPDIVHTYRHTVSSAGKENMEKEKKKLISDREFEEVLQKGAKPEGHSSKLPPYGFYIQGDADPTPGPTEPWVYVMHEPPPLLSTPAEAHLYFSPSHMAGKGNPSARSHPSRNTRISVSSISSHF